MRHELRALLHQLQPQLFGSLQTHRIVFRVLPDHLLQLSSHILLRQNFVNGFGREPIVLLRRNIGSGGNAIGRVDEPQNQEAAVARPGRVRELEWLHAVLKRVGKSDHAVLLALQGAKKLNRRLISHSFGSEDCRQWLMHVLFVAEAQLIELGLHSEVNCRACNVFNVVVVDSCAYDVCEPCQ